MPQPLTDRKVVNATEYVATTSRNKLFNQTHLTRDKFSEDTEYWLEIYEDNIIMCKSFANPHVYDPNVCNLFAKWY